jgi:hypothetical protein
MHVGTLAIAVALEGSRSDACDTGRIPLDKLVTARTIDPVDTVADDDLAQAPR